MPESQFLKLKRLQNKYKDIFKETTGRELIEYLHFLNGFELSKFMDDFFPNYLYMYSSTKEIITKKWGKEFCDIIKALLLI